SFYLFWQETPFYFRRISHHQTVIRYFLIFKNQTSGGYQTVFADFRPVHHHGSHAYQTVVPNPAAVENGIVPYRYIISHYRGKIHGGMDGTVILDIRAF